MLPTFGVTPGAFCLRPVAVQPPEVVVIMSVRSARPFARTSFARRVPRALVWSAFALLLLSLVGCGQGPDSEEREERVMNASMDRLAPGSYRGIVMNESHELGLDTLECEVDSSHVTVRLPDGDAVIVAVDAMSESETEVWEIRGAETRTGDRWVIRIQR